jgi:predicted SAM-dependent methyltransferase
MRLGLRNLQNAVWDLWSDVSAEVRHGRDLRRHCSGKTDISLNIGCGELIRGGWVNVDLQPRAGVYYLNVINGLPIQSGTVARIHAEHFLEHLEYDDAVSFLLECHRVLKVGGALRIVVPDAEKYLRAYVNDDVVFFEQLKNLGGSSEALPTKCAICNQMFHMGGHHRFSWDFETLQFAARSVGFNDVSRSHHNDETLGECIDGQDWWRPLESLYANLNR